MTGVLPDVTDASSIQWDKRICTCELADKFTVAVTVDAAALS